MLPCPAAAAAAAKSLQSCPTLCDPIDGSPPGSPVPGILQARTLEWLPLPSPMCEVKSESEVAQSCPTLSDPMDCSLPDSSIHGIFQARVLEWVAIAFSGFYVLAITNRAAINTRVHMFFSIMVFSGYIPHSVPNRKRSTSRLYIVTLLI